MLIPPQNYLFFKSPQNSLKLLNCNIVYTIREKFCIDFVISTKKNFGVWNFCSLELYTQYLKLVVAVKNMFISRVLL